ncbi:hypothetical protein ACLVWQ_39440 [Streptomyces sp. CWNU-52B]|uniref:Rv1733c family protein n=1 Tax=unclassified Streptomyces TaxID=2593676 RepID=UPI0039BFABD0
MPKVRRTKVLGWRWRHNPLRRHSDAVEAWIVLATWVLATVGGVAVGAVSAQGMQDAMTRSRAAREEVSAVLLETAPAGLRDVTTGAVYSQVRARVRWTDDTGTVRTDSARVRAGTEAGATVPVWTDGHGRLVPAPMSRAEAQARAILTGSGVTAFGGLVILAGGRLVRLRVERRATEQWGEEWELVGPRWRRRAG